MYISIFPSAKLEKVQTLESKRSVVAHIKLLDDFYCVSEYIIDFQPHNSGGFRTLLRCHKIECILIRSNFLFHFIHTDLNPIRKTLRQARSQLSRMRALERECKTERERSAFVQHVSLRSQLHEDESLLLCSPPPPTITLIYTGSVQTNHTCI